MKNGFTAIELLLVLAILGIFIGIAYPAYQSYLLHDRRYDGQVALLDLASQMEHFYAERLTYKTATIGTGKSTDIKSTNLSSERWYVLTILSQTSDSFILHATPINAQKRDKECQTFTLDHLGIKGIAAGPYGEPSATTTQCWK
ncbi:type IV pilin protein [Legionella hackeliae]|uniref:Putative Type 4 fimbrial biogenesis protein PilE n=1 Tax=Legionella hackeliae TaxID=449 RepID=A0A0A8UWQ4_LEGHA|nr:type IV pilin protein [Legionella hackeliae]KTD15456.1 Type-IV pilin [Legionella hackeliae]CEK11174.1 putative Type 4 fimbrial biogenesis protein PilE [Legionella hackeliae]STX47939.1 Type-IV pilin [Legionella hackeliae]